MTAYATHCICHHYLLLTSAIITELDSVFDVSKKSRRKSVFDQCLVRCAMYLPVVTPYTWNSIDTYVCHSNLVGLLNDSLLVDQVMASLCGGAIIPELCVYISLWYLAGGSYMDIFFLIGMYYGRQLRQLTNVQNYGLLGPTPTKGKLNVLVDLHPLAQIVPCMNVLLFWMDTICKLLPRKKYIMCGHTFQDTTKPME